MKYLLAFLLLYAVIPVTAQHRARVSNAEVTGTFVDKYGSAFKLLALGTNRLQIEFNGISPTRTTERGKPGANVVNTGFASGIAEIRADTVVLKPNGNYSTCPIIIWFRKPGYIQVRQEAAECGFGHNIRATGSYYKATNRIPKFSKGQ